MAQKFTLAIGDNAQIVVSGENGAVIGRAQYVKDENSYLIRYKNAEGRAVEQWWPQSALAQADS